MNSLSNPFSPISKELKSISAGSESKDDKRDLTVAALNRHISQHGIHSVSPGRWGKRGVFSDIRSHTLLCIEGPPGRLKRLFVMSGNRETEKTAVDVLSSRVYSVSSVNKRLPKQARAEARQRLQRAHRLCVAFSEDTYCLSASNSKGKRTVYWLHAKQDVRALQPGENGDELLRVVSQVGVVLRNASHYYGILPKGLTHNSFVLGEDRGLVNLNGEHDIKDVRDAKREIKALMSDYIDSLTRAQICTPHQADCLKVLTSPSPAVKWVRSYLQEQLSAEAPETSYLFKTRASIDEEFQNIVMSRFSNPDWALRRFKGYLQRAELDLTITNPAGVVSKGYSFKAMVQSGLMGADFDTCMLPFTIRRTSQNEILVMTNMDEKKDPLGKRQDALGYTRLQYNLSTGDWMSLRLLHPNQCGNVHVLQDEVDMATSLGRSATIERFSGKTAGVLMRYVERDLSTLHNERVVESHTRFTPIEVLRIAQGLLRDLHAMHRQGIIHQHITLTSVFVEGEGADLQVGVKDFRFASRLKDGHSRVRSRLPGLAPEEGRVGFKGASVRTDYYALGCVLFEMFCDSRHRDIEKGTSISETYQPCSRIDDQTDEEKTFMQQLIRSCLANKPRERLKTAGFSGLEDALRQCEALIDLRAQAIFSTEGHYEDAFSEVSDTSWDSVEFSPERIAFNAMAKCRVTEPERALEDFVNYIDENNVKIEFPEGSDCLQKGYSFTLLRARGVFNGCEWPFTLRKTDDGDVLVMTNLGINKKPKVKMEGASKYARLQYNLTQRKWVVLRMLHPHIALFSDGLEQEKKVLQVLGRPVSQVHFYGKTKGLLTEPMDKNLNDMLHQRQVTKRPLSSVEALRLVYGVLSDLNRMHQAGFLHRDIKIDNVLVKGQSDSLVAQLDDFDLSGELGPKETVIPSGIYGAYVGFAPESVRPGFEGCSKATDYYAFGSMLLYIFCDYNMVSLPQGDTMVKNTLAGFSINPATCDIQIDSKGLSDTAVKEEVESSFGKRVKIQGATLPETRFIQQLMYHCLRYNPSDRLSSSGWTIGDVLAECGRLLGGKIPGVPT